MTASPAKIAGLFREPAKISSTAGAVGISCVIAGKETSHAARDSTAGGNMKRASFSLRRRARQIHAARARARA